MISQRPHAVHRAHVVLETAERVPDRGDRASEALGDLSHGQVHLEIPRHVVLEPAGQRLPEADQHPVLTRPHGDAQPPRDLVARPLADRRHGVTVARRSTIVDFCRARCGMVLS